MGLFSGISKAISGISKALGAIGKVAKAVTGILNSPIGNLLKMAFPPLNFATGTLAFMSTLGDIGNSVGRGMNY